MLVIDVTQFGASPDSGSDTAPAVSRAIAALQKSGSGELRFPPGTYHFFPDALPVTTCWISNHDSGQRRIALPLQDVEDLTVQAEGTTFIFHGRVIPVWLGDCQRVQWTGGTIDWAGPMHFEAEVTASASDSFEFALPNSERITFRDGQCYLRGDGWEDELHDYLFFDPITRHVVPGTEDHFCNGYFAGRHAFKALDGGRFRVHPRDPLVTAPPVGSRLVLQGNTRDCPGIVIDDCADVRIEALTIRHCINMGVLAQNSRDITLSRVKIAPDPNSSRLVSSGNDATHFVGCAGHIELRDCRFQGMLDDATNVHGHYARIEAHPKPNQLRVRHMHAQQNGFRLAAPGETIAIVDPDNFSHRQTIDVTEFTRMNAEQSRITLDNPLDFDPTGYLLENLSRQPDLTVTGCHFSGNRARGILVATRGNVRITNNHIAAPGAGIAIIPDCNYWYESSPTRDVLIQGNTFDRCLSSPGWGDAVILVQTELKDIPPGGFLHDTIRVEDNTFRTADPRLMQAQSVANLTISGNRLEPGSDFPDATESPSDGPFHIRDCGEVELSENGSD